MKVFEFKQTEIQNCGRKISKLIEVIINHQNYLIKSSLITSDTFNEGNCKRIKLIGLMSFVDNSQRNTETQTFQITNFLIQSDDFRKKVNSQFQNIATTSARSK